MGAQDDALDRWTLGAQEVRRLDRWAEWVFDVLDGFVEGLIVVVLIVSLAAVAAGFAWNEWLLISRRC